MAATVAPRLAHVVLQTPQPDAMREFYTTLLDGRVVYAGHGLTFITCDSEHHRIAFGTLPADTPRKKSTDAGLHHIAFTLGDLDALLARYSKVAAKGLKPAVPIQHGVTTSLYYRDPDGNFVELQVDNFASPDEATAYMRGPEYDADCIGPAFDVERMLAARAAGASAAELMTRKWALAGPPLPDPLTVLMAEA